MKVTIAPGAFFAGALVGHHMHPAGCRLADLQGLGDRNASVDAVEWTLSHGPGGPSATRSVLLCGRTSVEQMSMDAFAERLAQLRGLLDGSYGQGRADLVVTCQRRSGDEPSAWGAMRAGFLSDLRDALAAVAPALDRLDPVALAGSVDRFDKRMAGLYALLDTRTDPDAPLGVAHAMRPHFGDTLRTMYRVHGNSVRAATKDRDADALDGLLRRAMTVGNGGSARAASLGMAVSKAMDAMAPGDLGRVRGGCRARTHGSGGGALDPPVVLGRLLAGMPGDWVPRDTAGWVDLAWCVPALDHAVRRCAPGTAHLMLNAGGDWARLRGRLASAAGLPGDEGPDGLGTAIRDVGDMARAFETQVLRPACHLSGVRAGRDGVEVAAALLHDGRTLRRSLEMSARWHAAQPRMSAALALLPGASPRSWPAALPDWSWDGVDIVVLTDVEQLRAEGADAPDADGVMGLRHCVGTYSGSCMSGHSRIVSLRRSGASGTERLSTAQLRHSRDGLALLQHRGRGNGEPCAEAHAALAAYAGAIHDGRLRVDEAGLAPVPDRGLVSGAAGYDVNADGNWSRALALWEPHLPRHLRGVGMGALARLFGRPRDAFPSDMDDVMVDIKGRGEHWQPTPFILDVVPPGLDVSRVPQGAAA